MNRSVANIIKVFAILFVLLHVGVTGHLGATASGPLFHNDYALMIYQQHKAVEFFSGFGSLWGYETGYAAGYPLNFTWNSNVILQFLSVLLHPVPEHIVLLWTTVFSVAMAPFAFFFGLKNFGVDGTKRNLATILLLAYWWTGLPATFMLLGMPAGTIVFHMAFFIVSVFYRIVDADERRLWPWLYALIPLSFLAHKTALVILGIPFMIIITCYVRRVRIGCYAHLAAIAALTLAVNSFWLIPFLDLAKFRVALADAPHGLHFDPLRIFKDYFTFTKIMGHKVVSDTNSLVLTVPNTILRNFLLWFGLYGLFRIWKDGRRALAAAIFFIVAIYMAEVYFGSFWWFSALFYPTRYIAYMDWFLVIPAVTGAAAAYRALAPKFGAAPGTAIAIAALTILLIATAPTYILFTRLTDRRLDEDTLQLAKFLKEETTPNGRVLLEDSGWNDRGGAPPQYSESHFPSLLSDITGREYIGGPYPYVFLEHHYAGFHDGTFLERDIRSYSTRELSRALNDYYIRWIVCWGSGCSETFAADGQRFKKLAGIGKFDVFEFTDFDMNPFLTGEGFTVADHRGIRCYRVGAEDGRAVLKYHALESLETGAGGETGSAPVGSDPVGFIEIENPRANFIIRNTYDNKLEGGISGLLGAGADYRPGGNDGGD